MKRLLYLHPAVLVLLLTVVGSTAHAQTGLSSQWFATSAAGDGGNNELEYYLPSQVSVNSGYVQLTAINQANGGHPYTSGRIVWSTFNFTYGEVEYRAKMSGGTGTWPAIWLLGYECQPSTAQMRDAASCNWPNPGSDEIDLTEILGSDLTSVNQQVHSANSNAGCRPSGIADVSQNFHVYDFVWSPTELVWYIDGVQTCSLSSSNISATNKYLIINVAVGGIGTVTPDPKTLPQSTYVDYVRVYSQPSYPPTGTPIFDDEFGSTTRPNPPTSLQEITK